jgi:hypothetical protein
MPHEAEAEAKLEALREQGRARAQAEERREQAIRERYKGDAQIRRERAAKLHTFATWRSVAPWSSVAWLLGCFTVFVGLGFLTLAIGCPDTIAISLRTSLVGTSLTLLGLLGIQHGRKQTRDFIASLPFPLENYEAALDAIACSDEYDAPQTRKLVITFHDGFPSRDVLTQALKAVEVRQPMRPYDPLTVHAGCSATLTLCAGSHFKGHARWLARTMPDLSQALVTLHGVYPIKSVSFECE